MKNFQCDICGKETGEYEIYTLYEKYTPSGVEHVCKDCYNELRDAKVAMSLAIDSLRDNWVMKILKKMVRRNKND